MREYRGELSSGVVTPTWIAFLRQVLGGSVKMQRHNYISLPCQFCEKPERRVSWRNGNAVTCFSCKTMRRNELAQLKARRSPGSTAPTLLPSAAS